MINAAGQLGQDPHLLASVAHVNGPLGKPFDGFGLCHPVHMVLVELNGVHELIAQRHCQFLGLGYSEVHTSYEQGTLVFKVTPGHLG